MRNRGGGAAAKRAFAAFALLVLVLAGTAAAGAVKWTYDAPGAPYPALGSHGSRIIVATDSGRLVALNKSSGRFDWDVQMGASISSAPVYSADDGRIYVATSDGTLHAVDPENGAKIWSTKFEGLCGASPAGNWGSSPYAYGGAVYIGSENGCVYAFNATDKTIIWTRETGGPIRSTPVFYQGRIYVGSGDSNAYSLDAGTGKILGKYKADGAIWTSSPAVYDGKIYVGSVDGKLYALNASNLRQIGSFATGGWVASTPLAYEGVVYFGSDDTYFYAIDASTLQLRWKFRTGSSVQGSAKAVLSTRGTMVLFGGNDGTLYALRANSGTLVWNFTAGDWAGSPLVEGDRVYLPSYDGKVYGLSSLFCTIDYPPENSSTSDNYLELRGSAVSNDGVRAVRVRLNRGPWSPAYGASDWSANVSLQGLPFGRFEVECSALDSNGREEALPLSKAAYEKAEYAPPKEMQVTYPRQVGAGEKFSVGALADDGTPLAGAELRVPTVSNYAYKADEKGAYELSFRDAGKYGVEITREGYSKKTFEIEATQGAGTNTYIYVAGAILAVAAVVFFVRRRRSS